MEENLIFESQGKQLYKNLLCYIKSITDTVGSNGKIQLNGTLDICRYIIEDFKRSSDLLIMAMTYFDPGDLAVSHSLNVAICALKMAIDMKLSEKEIEDVLCAGLLHDIGFGRLDIFYEDVSNENDKKIEESITKKDKELVHLHPQYGMESLLVEDERSKLIAEAIMQHHEKADGSGFPQGLKDSEQVLTAKILAIVDTYECLIHPRIYRDALVPTIGIRTILRDKKTLFSECMKKQLLDSFAIYPVGHYVKLSDGSTAKVMKNYKGLPLQPDVEVCCKSSGEKVDPPIALKLNDNKVMIIKCLPAQKRGD